MVGIVCRYLRYCGAPYRTLKDEYTIRTSTCSVVIAPEELFVWYYECIVWYVVMYVHMCTLVCSDVESVITCYYM